MRTLAGRVLAARALSAGALLLAPGTALAGGATGGGAGSGGGSPSTASLASATLEQCTVAVDQAGRAASFNGQMSAVPGARRMAMQIVVQEQAPGEADFHALAAAASGWRRSEAGVKIYRFVRQVTDLPAPGTFRAVVLFRWLNEKGRVIKRAARHTDACVQPDERPKLLVAQIQAEPLPGALRAEYRVLVRNDGRGAAGPSAVALLVAGQLQPSQPVPALAAGARTLLKLQGPVCAAGQEVEVQLDPAHQLAEAPGGGESDTVACPL